MLNRTFKKKKVLQDIYDLIFLVFICRKVQMSSIVRILFLCPVPNQLQSRGVWPFIVTHLQALLTLSLSGRPNQPESLSWPERQNQPEYRGTIKLRTAKLCHHIMAIYYSSSDVVMLKLHWQLLKICNAGYFRGYKL